MHLHLQTSPAGLSLRASLLFLSFYLVLLTPTPPLRGQVASVLKVQGALLASLVGGLAVKNVLRKLARLFIPLFYQSLRVSIYPKSQKRIGRRTTFFFPIQEHQLNFFPKKEVSVEVGVGESDQGNTILGGLEFSSYPPARFKPGHPDSAFHLGFVNFQPFKSLPNLESGLIFSARPPEMATRLRGDTSVTTAETQSTSLPRIVHLQPSFDLRVSFDLHQAFSQFGHNSAKQNPTYLISLDPVVSSDPATAGLHQIRSLFSIQYHIPGQGLSKKPSSSSLPTPSPSLNTTLSTSWTLIK